MMGIMHEIQEKILELSKSENLAKLSLRDVAKLIGQPLEAPQKIKHHLLQLEKKGFLALDRAKGVMTRAANTPTWAKGLTENNLNIFSIPVIGTANCGPATIFAEQNFQGFLRVSSKLVGRSRPRGLYAIKTDGLSMNRAKVGDKFIDDGDYVIVDSESRSASTGDIVLALVDNKATIKRYIDDRKENDQIVLKAESSLDYEPIYIHEDDDFSITGKVVGLIKNPK